MKKTNRGFVLAIFLILLCCIGAASASDIDASDVSNGVSIDAVTDVVGDLDDAQEDVTIENLADESDAIAVDDSNGGGAKANIAYVDILNYNSTFDSNGNLRSDVSASALSFSGDFSNMPFDNFIINKNIGVQLNSAVFNNVGFKLIAPGIPLSGGTFNGDSAATNGASIYIGAANITVSGVNINVTANPTIDTYAINISGGNNSVVQDSKITYYAPVANASKYDHVIRVVNSENVEILSNNITSFLPLKAVDYNQPFPSIYTDHVAVIAVQSSNKLNLRYNKIKNNVSSTDNSYYPTLDTVIMVDSNNSDIYYNDVVVFDPITGLNQANYLYAVDLYECYNLDVYNNNISINSNGGIVVTNGSGAAYPIQITGPYDTINIKYNNLTSANNGPNCGIYSQNYYGVTNDLIIEHNKIIVTGKAGTSSYSLVSGIETQDTYSTVRFNDIYVNNTAGYNPNYFAFGISYAQWTNNTHRFLIMNNNVIVENGQYAVYLLSAYRSRVQSNGLNSTVYTGNDAVNIVSGTGNSVSGNHAATAIPMLLSNNNYSATLNDNFNVLGEEIPINKKLSPNLLMMDLDDYILSDVDSYEKNIFSKNIISSNVLSEGDIIIYVGPNEVDGNGSLENPYRDFNLACDAISDSGADSVTIYVLDGTYTLDSYLEFDAKNLDIIGLGDVIVNCINIDQDTEDAHWDSGDGLDFCAFALPLVDTYNATFANIKFDGSMFQLSFNEYLEDYAVDGDSLDFDELFGSFFYPYVGYNAVFENCSFIPFVGDIVPAFSQSFTFKSCVFKDVGEIIGANGNSFFEYCSLVNVETLAMIGDSVILNNSWFGQNSAMFDDKATVNNYAVLSISENYLDGNEYEIIGNFSWDDGTCDDIGRLGVKTVTLSSETGTLEDTEVLMENGTFSVKYNASSGVNTVTATLDNAVVPISFNYVVPIEVYVGTPSSGDGEGTLENPYKDFQLASQACSDYDNVTIYILNGTYIFDYLPVFECKNVDFIGLGEARICYVAEESDGCHYAFFFTDPSAEVKFENIIFDASGASDGEWQGEIEPVECDYLSSDMLEDVDELMEANFIYIFIGSTAEFSNCSFLEIGAYLIPAFQWGVEVDQNRVFNDCNFTIRGDELYNGFSNEHVAFNYCNIYAHEDFIMDNEDMDTTLNHVWMGINELTDFDDYTIINPAVFSIFERYLGGNEYEIIGNFSWDDGTNDGIERLGVKTVTLSTETGSLEDTTVLLENGTFSVRYNASSVDNAVTATLDDEVVPISFKLLEIGVEADSIEYGEYPNLTISFASPFVGTVFVNVKNDDFDADYTFELAEEASSANYVIEEILSAGSYEITVSVNDTENGIYGSGSTNIEVSKISDYTFNPSWPALNPKVGDDFAIGLELPEDANGTVTVYVNDNPFYQNASADTEIIVNGLVLGDNNIIIEYSGNEKYMNKSVETVLTAEKHSPLLSVEDVTVLAGSGILNVSLTEDSKGIEGKTINLLVGNAILSGVTDDEGIAAIDLSILAPNVYSDLKVTFDGDDSYEGSNGTVTVTVNKVPVNASINLLVNYDEVIAIVKDLEGNPIANCPITFEITDSEGDIVDDDVLTDENGEYSIAANGGDTIVVFYNDENGIVSSSVTISEELTDLVEDLEDSLNQTQEELNEAKDNITALESQVEELSQNLTEAQKDLDEANGKIDNLTEDLAQAQSDLEDAKAEITNLTEQVDDISEKLNQSEADLAAANAKVGELSAEVTALNDTVESQAALIGDLNETVNNQTATINEQTEAIDSLNAALDNQTATINDQAEAIDSLNAALDNQTATIADLNKKVDDLLKIIDELNKTTELNRTVTKIIYENMTTTSVSSLDGRVGKYFVVQLVDAEGKALANMPIGIGFNGKVYDRTTDENGSAKLQINLAKKGTYTFAIAYLGDDKYNGSFEVAKIVVTPQTPKLTTSSKTYKATAKTKTLTATFKTVNGNPIKGKKISFTVNGKTYTGTTNANGVASVKVSISKKGTYSFTAKYAGDNIYGAVTKSAKLTIK